MAVQLDVRDLVDVAVRGEDALLVFAAEERDLDLLTLVLAGVVLDVAQPSARGSTGRRGVTRRPGYAPFAYCE